MHIKHFRPVLLVFGLVVLGAALVIMIKQTFSREVPSLEIPAGVVESAPFKISSPVFDASGSIPTSYTCDNSQLTLPLSIQNPPSNTKEFALIMYDNSGPSESRTHWVLWNIPSATTLIAENTLPEGTKQGVSGNGTARYVAPCPIAGSGKHQYVFELYALNDVVNLETTSTKDNLIAAINGKVISKVQLIGTVAAQ